MTYSSRTHTARGRSSASAMRPKDARRRTKKGRR